MDFENYCTDLFINYCRLCSICSSSESLRTHETLNLNEQALKRVDQFGMSSVWLQHRERCPAYLYVGSQGHAVGDGVYVFSDA